LPHQPESLKKKEMIISVDVNTCKNVNNV
jgi:hypothetical protein